MLLRLPTQTLVDRAIKKFNHDAADDNEAMRLLLKSFPLNENFPSVLLKVVALNTIYRTQILAVHDVAHLIYSTKNIDVKLANGSLDVVQHIANVKIGAKQRNNYSFATKYCSWHNPEKFPIYDSRVDRYLWKLQKQTGFCKSFTHHYNLKDYKHFCEIIHCFRDSYKLQVSIRDLDKFLYEVGGAI